MVRIAFPVATIAFWGPRRRAMSVSGAEEALASAGDGGGDVAEGGGQPGVALGAALVLALAGRLVGGRAELGPGHQMGSRREPAHVDPHLGDELLRGDGAGAGDLGELLRLMDERGD